MDCSSQTLECFERLLADDVCTTVLFGFQERQPLNSGAITQAERDAANNLIDKNYERCRKLLGANDPEAGHLNQLQL